MPSGIEDLLEVSIKQVKCKMMSTSKLKVFLLVLAVIVYVYVLMFVKHFYMNSKRLDRILDMTLESEKQLLKVQHMDQKLAAKISDIEKVYEVY